MFLIYFGILLLPFWLFVTVSLGFGFVLSMISLAGSRAKPFFWISFGVLVSIGLCLVYLSTYRWEQNQGDTTDVVNFLIAKTHDVGAYSVSASTVLLGSIRIAKSCRGWFTDSLTLALFVSSAAFAVLMLYKSGVYAWLSSE